MLAILPDAMQPLTVPYRLITPQEAVREVSRLLADGANVAVDSETTGLDAWDSRLITVQFGTPSGAFIVDLRHADESEWAALAEVVRLLFSGRVELLGPSV